MVRVLTVIPPATAVHKQALQSLLGNQILQEDTQMSFTVSTYGVTFTWDIVPRMESKGNSILRMKLSVHKKKIQSTVLLPTKAHTSVYPL